MALGAAQTVAAHYHRMKQAPMPLADRLELAAQACRAAHLLSCEATCREAAELLASSEYVPLPARELADRLERLKAKRDYYAGKLGSSDRDAALENFDHALREGFPTIIASLRGKRGRECPDCGATGSTPIGICLGCGGTGTRISGGLPK